MEISSLLPGNYMQLVIVTLKSTIKIKLIKKTLFNFVYLLNQINHLTFSQNPSFEVKDIQLKSRLISRIMYTLCSIGSAKRIYK